MYVWVAMELNMFWIDDMSKVTIQRDEYHRLLEAQAACRRILEEIIAPIVESDPQVFSPPPGVDPEGASILSEHPLVILGQGVYARRLMPGTRQGA